MDRRTVSVIISTYNKPDWLEKCLLGYACQSHEGFEVVVADDGSTDETKDLIDDLRERTGLSIRHVWHADEGFRKTIILNKAILAAQGEYLIFSDGDCIPRRDFVEVHVRNARPGHFVSGGYCKLPMELSRNIGEKEIRSGEFADPVWLRRRGVRQPASLWKLHVGGPLARLLNAATPTRPTWNGHNASGWTADLLRVNGFDERMAYGGEDREMGDRLVNLGLRGRQVRYSAICLHLDHDRPWRERDAMALNDEIRAHTITTQASWTEHGIEKRPAPPEQASTDAARALTG